MGSKLTSLAVILGTRAEFLKCAPLLQYLEGARVEHRVLLTGQNNVDDMVKDFGISDDNLVRLKSFQGVSLNPLTGLRRTPAIVREIRVLLQQLHARRAIFHGDTATTFAAALAVEKHECDGAHIEAGLRSGSILEPIPEELFRTVADRRSAMLFSPSLAASENLRRERIRGRVVLTGNTICDVLEMVTRKVGKRVTSERFVLMTSHRYENVFVRSRLKRILQILDLCQLPVYWPLHMLTEAQLKRFGLFDRVRKMSNVHLLPPMAYTDFVSNLAQCSYVITDGGGIEEESLILKKPCLLLRRRTERGEGIRMGLTFLTKLDLRYAGAIVRRLDSGYSPPSVATNPYIFSGSPSEMIGKVLQEGLV